MKVASNRKRASAGGGSKKVGRRTDITKKGSRKRTGKSEVHLSEKAEERPQVSSDRPKAAVGGWKGRRGSRAGAKVGAKKSGHKKVPGKRFVGGDDVAGLAIFMTAYVRVGPQAEEKTVVLDGRIRRARGVVRDAFPRLEDRERAAKHVVGGQKPEKVAELLAAMSHPQRIRILGKLLATEATHRLLAKATGLKAGPLYHHIRELRGSGLIGPKTRDLYVLTPKGRRAILAALAIGRLCG